MLYQVDGYEVDLYSTLGSGTFGRVYPCRKTNSPEFDLCCKAICIESLKKNQMEYDKTLRETHIMIKLKEISKTNENVVQFYHTTQVIFENQEHILIFMERCNTDLKEYLKTNKVNVLDAVNILKQIINGYRICYENSIMHRDLKPANILMKGNVCKLTDFGEGKIVKEIDKILQQTKAGTPIYQSPQMFNPSAEICSAKTDIFSLGVIFYEILYASLPFQLSRKGIEEFHKQLSQKAFNPPNVNHSNQLINQQIIELLKNMLTYSDKDRISWQDLFNHPLIKIVFQEQKNIKKIVKSEMKQNNLLFKPSQVVQIQQQRNPTIQAQKINVQPIIGQIPQTQNIIQPNQIIPQQITPNLQNRFGTLQPPIQSMQKPPQQINQGQSSIPTGIPTGTPIGIPNIGINNSIFIKTLDCQTLIIALKYIRNFMNSFEKYGNVNPSVHEQVDQVVGICKQLLTSICYQILLKQSNQICDEQFRNLKNPLEIQQVQIYIEYSLKAREQNKNFPILDLGNQLKQILERVFQFFPFDRNRNYEESYVNFKINMKNIIQDRIQFTDLQVCNFGTPNETQLY